MNDLTVNTCRHCSLQDDNYRIGLDPNSFLLAPQISHAGTVTLEGCVHKEVALQRNVVTAPGNVKHLCAFE